MTLPERFVGAWERTGVVVDGAPVPDAGRVVWVEAGTAYVDVRGPGAFASDTTFAGVTTWDEPHLTWAHTIDAELDGGVDVGLISYDGEDMIEEGEYEDGRVIRYAERWTRLPAQLRSGARRGDGRRHRGAGRRPRVRRRGPAFDRWRASRRATTAGTAAPGSTRSSSATRPTACSCPTRSNRMWNPPTGWSWT